MYGTGLKRYSFEFYDYAIINNSEQAIDILIKHNYDAKSTSVIHKPALHIALSIEKPNIAIVNILITY